MYIKFTILLASLFAFVSTLSAQIYSADITFGYDSSVFDDGTYDSVGDTWGRFFDSTGTTPLASDDSVAAIGYFTTEPTSWSANIGVLDDFVFLTQGSVEVFAGTPYPGDFNITSTNVDVSAGRGETAYFVVFKGITDTANYASATEFAVLSSGVWSQLNGSLAPAPPTPLVYTVGRTAIGTGVYVGTEVDDSRFDEDEGFNYYTTVVPEPSTFALLFGLFALFFTARRR